MTTVASHLDLSLFSFHPNLAFSGILKYDFISKHNLFISPGMECCKIENEFFYFTNSKNNNHHQITTTPWSFWGCMGSMEAMFIHTKLYYILLKQWATPRDPYDAKNFEPSLSKLNYNFCIIWDVLRILLCTTPWL